MERRAVLSLLLATGVLVLCQSLLAVAQDLQLTASTLEPPADQLSATTTTPNNPNRYNLMTGAVFTTSCTFTHASSDAFTVAFYKDGLEINAGDLADTTLTGPMPGMEQTIELTFNIFQAAHDGVYHCSASTDDGSETVSSDPYLYGSEDPPPPPVRVTPRYVVLDTSTDLVLEARFRGNYYAHDWVYNENDPTFETGTTSLFTAATRTNVGQTYTILAGADALRVGYYGPSITLTDGGTSVQPTPENTVIVGSYIAPTIVINGVENAQVGAIVGEDVTIAFTASGFPGVTFNTQVPGVSSTPTITDPPSLMTEATPTTAMEATRLVTLHSITAQDCTAVVVTCTAMNMNSDGTPMMAVATATLNPSVPFASITPSEEVLNVGDTLTLTCTGGNCNGDTTFTFTWLLDGSQVDTSLVTDIDGTTSQLSVTSVTSTDFGTYTCQVTNVDGTGTAVSTVRETVPLQLTASTFAPPADQLSATTTSGNNPNRYNLMTGAVFTISCAFTYETDAFTVAFYKDGVMISDGGLADTTLTVPGPGMEQTIALTFGDFQAVHDGVYHCSASTDDGSETVSSDPYLYGSADPPPDPVRVTPRYVVLDTSTDLVLEARFRGSYYAHDWVYNEDDPTFGTGTTSLFPSANRTNVGQTYTISAGSASLVVGYYGPSITLTDGGTPEQPTPDNTVIVGSYIAPTVLINGLETAPVTATVGEDVTIVCTARGFPDITIDILVTGATGAQFIGTQTLVTEATPTTPQEVTRAVTISIMTALDCEAMVTCEANNMNSDGSPMRDEATATLQHPSASLSPSEPVLSVGGDPLTLTCTGGDCAASSFTFSWLLDGSPVNTSLVTDIDGTTSQLSVTSVTSADFGTYTCQVTSVHGTGTAVSYVREMGSLEFTIDLTAPPNTSLHTSLSVLDGETNRYNIEPSATFSITCTAESPDDFTLEAFPVGVENMADVDVSLDESNTSLPTTYVKTLTISFSTFSPSSNGMYWCRAESSTTPNVLESRRILLGTGPATVTQVSSTYTELIPPNSLELQVMVTGAYERLTWSHNGTELRSDSVNFTDFCQTLTISSTTSVDAGVYAAAAPPFVPLGFRVREFIAPQVNISAPPFLIQGEILTVNCSVTSFPSSAISMFFRGTRILLASGIASYSTAGLWYRFTYSTTAMYPSDEGNYTCSATITHGQPAVTEVYSETVFVPVYVSPEVNITAETVVVNETNPAVLTCVSTGIPEPEIMWFREGVNMMIDSDGTKYNISSTTRMLGNRNMEVTSTLTVFDTSVSDSGIYSCSATNLAGSAVDATELTVEAAPIMLNVTASPSTRVSQGMPLNLTCDAVGAPTASVMWTTPAGSMVGPTILIESVTTNDAGDYTCVVTTDTGAASESITIIVGVRVVVPPIDQSVNVNGTLSLACSASGSEPISYQWMKDGELLQDGRRVSGSGTNMLRVEPVQGEDYGGYSCRASNDVDQVMSEEAAVAVAPVIMNISATPSTEVPTGTQLNLTCEAVGGPTLNVTWTTPSGPRVGSTISVDSVTAVTAGDYTCEVTTEAGTTSDSITISVQAFILDPPMDLTVNQSSPATFSCTAQGNPVPTISWTGFSTDFTTRKVDIIGNNFTESSVLTIDSAVRALHEGVYTCSASNGVGASPSSSATLTVQVLPTVAAVQERVVGVEMMSVNLSFTISNASPEVQLQSIRWTFTSRGGGSYDIPMSQPGVYSFSDDQLTLTLSAVNGSNEGNYTLTATNEAGSDSASVFLEVESPPRIITPPMEQQVVADVDVTFDCLALAEPLHSLTWYFTSANGINTTIGSVNGTDNMITDGAKHQITDFTSPGDYGSLVVRDVQFEDRGVYMCLAENRHGSEAASATLAVQVLPTFISTSPRVEALMNSTDSVTLSCSLQGYPLSNLQWMKDGTPLTPDGSHITITTFRRQDPTDTYPFSSILNSNFEPIPQEGLEYFEAVSELTLVPPLLLTDTASYTCEVEARFVQSLTEASNSIPVLIIELPREFISNIKLIVGPVSDCPAWVDSNTDAKLSDIEAAITAPLQRDCNCPLTVQKGFFSCLGTENSQTAVFLAELSYIALPGAVNVSNLLASWVASTPPLRVASIQLQVDTACPVQANATDDQSCVPTTLSPPTSTTVPDNLALYILIGVDFLFVSVLAMVVVLLIIICVRLRKNKPQPYHRRRSFAAEENDYQGPGYMVMENLTKSTEVPDLVESPLGTDY